MKHLLKKITSLALMMLVIGLFDSKAQTDLTNNLASGSLTFGAGANTAMTFRVTNNNAASITVTRVIYPSHFTNPNGSNHTLWHSTTSLTGTPNISTAAGWVVDANVTNFTAIGGYQPLFSGLSIVIPAGATYRFAVNATTGSAATPGLLYGVAGSLPITVTSADNVILETGTTNIAGLRINMPSTLLSQRNYAGGITYIVNPANCSGLPNPGATISNANPVHGCPFTLSTQFNLGSTPGITFQWDSSTVGVGGPYSNIIGATASTYTSAAGITTSTYYRCRATCSFSTQTGISTPLQVVYSTNPFPEGFEGTQFAPNCWTGNVSATNWSRAAGVSANGVGAGSAKFDFWDIASGSFNLITPTFPAIGANQALVFDEAYATATGEDDQLQIYTSSDGGTSYSPLILLHGGMTGTLNTGGALGTAAFAPTTAQWKHIGFDLPAGTNRIKFTAISAFGNNMYLDNIDIGASINDITVTNLYTLGKIPIGFGANHVIQARVINNSTSTKTPNIVLSISGANTFTNTQSPVMGPGAVTILSFAAFTPSAVGIDNISVANTTADNNASNDAQTFTQIVTQNLYTYKDQTIANAGGVGFTGGTGDFVAKFNSANNFSDADTVNEIKVDFFGGGQTLSIGIWDATGAGGSPGTNLWTSAPFLSPTGTAFISVPNIVVSGGFYCGVRQTGTVNANFAYQNEVPIRTGTFYYTAPTGGTAWNDFASTSSNFRFSIEPQMKIRIPPNCPINLSPANASLVCPLNPVSLSWFSGGGGATSYDVYFSTVQADVAAHSGAALVSPAQAGTIYNAGSLTPGATYYWTIVANNSDGGSPGCAVQSFIMGTSFLDCYCTPVHNNACMAGQGIISNVTINTLNNTTGCNPNGYGSYAPTTSLAKGSSYNLSVTCDVSSIISVWIDWNHNGSLETTEWTQVDLASVPNVASTISIPIPVSALSGNTLMRIRSRITGNPNGDVDACTVFGSGEGEDYLINVTCGTSVSNNTPICLNDSIHLFSGPSGATSFSWSGPGFSSVLQNPSIGHAAAGNGGSYSVTVVSPGCSETVNTSVTFFAQPSVTPTNSGPFCDGTANLNLHANASGGTPGYGYSWSSVPAGFSSANSDPSITPGHPSDSKTYKVIVTDAHGCRDSASTSATVYALPNVVIIPVGGTNLCTGQTTLDLLGSNANSYLWSTTETTNPITVSTGGTYSVVGTDGNGCQNSASVTITASAPPVAPTVSPNGTLTLCSDAGGPIPITLNCTNYTTDLAWSTGDITQSISVNYPDVFNVTYTDANGCSSTSADIIVNNDVAAPVIPTHADITQCNPVVTFSSSPTDNCSVASVTYSPASGSTFSAGTTLVTITATDYSSNSSTSTFNVTINTSPVIGACPGDITQCDNHVATWTNPNATGSPVPTVVCSPASGSTFAAGTTTVTCTATNTCGSSSCSFNVTINDGPVIGSCPADITQCDNHVATWTNPTATGTPTPTVACVPASGSTFAFGTTSVTCTATNVCGSSSCSFNVTINTSSTAPTSISTTAVANNVCSGGGFTLTEVGGVLGTGAVYNWYTGSCGGTLVGTGATLTVASLTATTTYFVRAQGTCNTTACASITITVSTAPPVNSISSVNVPVSGCVGTSATATANTSTGAAFYSWSVGSGVTFGATHSASPYQTSTPSVQINFDALPPSGTSGWNVCVFAGNACGVSNNKCSFIRATTSTPGTITGSVVACPSSSGSYSIAAVTGAASYAWSVTGAASVSGTGTTATVTFNAGWTTGVLSVQALTACGYASASRTLAISSIPTIPGAITGPSVICPSSTASFSISAVAGATGYTWTSNVAGAVITPSGTSCSIVFPATIPSGASVCVTANSACGSSAQRCKSISSGVPGTPASISGPVYGNCAGVNIGFSIASMPLATGGYNWTVPTGCTFTGGSTNSILVTFPSNFISGNIAAQGVSATCGAGAFRTLTVYGRPNQPVVITGNVSVCNGGVETYCSSSANATSYNWTVPAGATILGSATGSCITVLWGATGGNISVTATNDCGTSTARTLAVTVTCRQSQLEASAAAINAEVYPNPSQGKMTLKFNSVNTAKYLVRVLDMTGRVVMYNNINAKEGINLHELDLTSLTKGVYMIQLESKDVREMLRVTLQ